MNLRFFPDGQPPEHVGLVGYGISTRAVIKELSGTEVRLTVRDGRDGLPQGTTLPKGTRVLLGKEYLTCIDEDVLVLSPSVRRDLPPLLEAMGRGVRLTSECELYFRDCESELYAVSGSDGKSTTVTLAHALLRAGGRYRSVMLGGNVGTPLLSLSRGDSASATVAELSSFQLSHYVPFAKRALLTNLTPNHLDWHVNVEEYYNAKICLLNRAKEPVINADDPKIVSRYKRDNAFAAYTAKQAISARAEHVYSLTCEGIVRDGVLLLPLDRIAHLSDMNRRNLLGALALCEGKIDTDALFSCLPTLTLLPHRAEHVGVLEGVLYVNSSADTTPSRTAATLSNTEGAVILLVGGRGKGVPYESVTAALGRVRHIVAYGENALDIRAALASAPCPLHTVETLRDAVMLAHALCDLGDTVLLSPMSTSHDQYSDYRARGEDFRRLVAELARAAAPDLDRPMPPSV